MPEHSYNWTHPSAPAAQIIYQLRQIDDGDELLEAATLDAVMDSIIDDGGEFDATFDALVVTSAKIETKAKQLGMAFSRAVSAVTLVEDGVTVTKPFKQNGSTQIAMMFEMSDGQTITVFLHNPDVKPNQLQASDVLVSWKWLLNRKDITIVVAPENGNDLALAQVAARIMALVDKNSVRFTKANAGRQARLALITGLEAEVTSKEATLKGLIEQIEAKRTTPKPDTPPAPQQREPLPFVPTIGHILMPSDYPEGFVEWEGEVLDALCSLEDLTHSDADGIYGGKGEVVARCWANGSDAITTAKAILEQSTVPQPVEVLPTQTVDIAEAVQTLLNDVLNGDEKSVRLVLKDANGSNNRIFETRWVKGGTKAAMARAEVELFDIARQQGIDTPQVSRIFYTPDVYPARTMLQLAGYTVTERFDINEHIPQDVKDFLVVDAHYDIARTNGVGGFYTSMQFRNYQTNYRYTDKMKVVAVFMGHATHHEEQVERLSQKIVTGDIVKTQVLDTKQEGYSVYTNSKGRVLFEVTRYVIAGQLSFGYKTEFSSGGLSSAADALRQLAMLKEYSPSAKLTSGVSLEAIAEEFKALEAEKPIPNIPVTPEPSPPVATSNPTAEFLQSVIDGKVDMMAADFAAQLTAVHEQTVNDAALTELFNQAVNAYSAMTIEQAQKALGK